MSAVISYAQAQEQVAPGAWGRFIVGNDGSPKFDRPTYVEVPFAQAVVWGEGSDGRIYFAMVEQERPHADVPGKYSENGHPAVLFSHVPMGFSAKNIAGRFETGVQTALREADEEAGTACAVVGVEDYGLHNPSPSFTATWGGVAGIQVNLAKLGGPVPDPDEPIAGVYFVEASALLAMIVKGKSERGAHTGVATSLSALMIHFAHHPEHFPR